MAGRRRGAGILVSSRLLRASVCVSHRHGAGQADLVGGGHGEARLGQDEAHRLPAVVGGEPEEGRVEQRLRAVRHALAGQGGDGVIALGVLAGLLEHLELAVATSDHTSGHVAHEGYTRAGSSVR